MSFAYVENYCLVFCGYYHGELLDRTHGDLRDMLRGERMNRPDKRNSLTQCTNRLDPPAPTRAGSLSTNLQPTRWPLAPLAQFSTRIDHRSLVLYSTSTNLLIRVSTQFLYTGLHNRTQLCTVSHYQFSTSTMTVPYTVQNQCTCTCIHVLMYIPWPTHPTYCTCTEYMYVCILPVQNARTSVFYLYRIHVLTYCCTVAYIR